VIFARPVTEAVFEGFDRIASLGLRFKCTDMYGATVWLMQEDDVMRFAEAVRGRPRHLRDGYLSAVHVGRASKPTRAGSPVG